MKRREFIAVIGGAAASPLVAQAQPSAMPIVGFLNPQSPEAIAEPMRGLRQGLKDAGFVEGENLTIEYRWADNRTERLSALAEDLVRRRVALIISTGGVQSALAAKGATMSIPIVFNVADDPVSVGLVASLAKPGGNLTGVAILVAELTAKRLELLHIMVPSAVNVAVLSNPNNPAAKAVLRELEGAAQSMGLKISSFQANSSQEIDAVFTNIARESVEALFIAGDAFFLSRRVQLALLAVSHKLPTIAALRDFTEVGGLMSYGASLRDAYRQVGTYAGRILKGANAVDLPVVQASKFELVINSQTARILGLTVPPSLLAAADETIE